MTFDKRQTNIVKGVALLLLLWHHLFYNNPDNYNMFTSMFFIKDIPVECFIAVFCKVCVAIFLFLSGYGLYKSYEKYSCSILEKSKFGIKEDFVFVKNHFLKLMSGYCFIYIIFVSMGFFFGRNPIEIYQGNIGYFLLDFMGISNIFATPSMNATWWFMSLIIILYIIYPVLHRLLFYSAELLLLASYFILVFYYLPELSGLRIYLFPFVLGMYFSKCNGFDFIDKKFNTTPKILTLSCLALMTVVWIKLTMFRLTAEIDGLLALSIVLCTYLIVSKIPVLNIILEHIGKHSGTIFMFHTFIYSYYFKNFIYAAKYSVIIFFVMVVLCYVAAVMISYIQKLICYDRLINKLTK